MATSVLKTADPALPVHPVHAIYGKGDRAEPVAMLFETGRARFAGTFPELEDELCAMTRGGGFARRGSPDRADAMVWAMTELMLGPARAEPRVRAL
jgi:phage terminase large subunit-like protein